MIVKITHLEPNAHTEASHFRLAICGIGLAGCKALESITIRGIELNELDIALFSFSYTDNEERKIAITNTCFECDWLLIITDFNENGITQSVRNCLQLFSDSPCVKACITLKEQMENPDFEDIESAFNKFFFSNSIEQLIAPVDILLSVGKSRLIAGADRTKLLEMLSQYRIFYISPQIIDHYPEDDRDPLVDKVERLLYCWGDYYGSTQWDAVTVGTFGKAFPFSCIEKIYSCVLTNRFKYRNEVCFCAISNPSDDNQATITMLRCIN